MKILSHHSKAVRDVEWSQDGRSLLSCSYDKTAAVTDVEKGVFNSSLMKMDFFLYQRYFD